MRRTLILLAAAVCGVAGKSRAQSPPPVDTTPFQVLTALAGHQGSCARMLTAPPPDPAASQRLWQFTLQTRGGTRAWSRTLQVGFDSAGTAQWLSDFVMVLPTGGRLAFVRLAGIDAEGTLAEAPLDSALGAQLLRATDSTDGQAIVGRVNLRAAEERSRPLTTEEIGRARRLAQWLWARGCDQ